MAPTIEQMRAAWQRWDGYVEGPANNETVFGKWYGFDKVPWCAEALSYMWIVECKGTLPMGPKGAAAVYSFRTSYQHAHQWGSDAKVGAFVCFGTDAHIGWVDELALNGFWFWSGNTGQGSYNNGGGVHRFFVNYAHPPEPIEGYCYPDYQPAEPEEEDDMILVLHPVAGPDTGGDFMVQGDKYVLLHSAAVEADLIHNKVVRKQDITQASHEWLCSVLTVVR